MVCDEIHKKRNKKSLNLFRQKKRGRDFAYNLKLNTKNEFSNFMIFFYFMFILLIKHFLNY